MLIRLADRAAPQPSEITPEPVYEARRHVLAAGLSMAAVAATPAWAGPAALVPAEPDDPRMPAWLRRQVAARTDSGYRSGGAPLTPYKDASTYNNFYEFGTDKADPSRLAGDFVAAPWNVRIDGEVARPGDYPLEDLLKGMPLEERIYRFRCVEAWSMVVPWVGFPLASLLRRVEPTAKARYVAFETLHDPARMPGQRGPAWIPWPYVEGLRIDEAAHPLTILAVGMYGRTLPAQNGAPLRLVVPWKYGFKSIKSIVRIRFLERQPPTTWSRMAAEEYGFFANVNPAVDHPRWSQRRERRLPTGLFSPNWAETLPFNGYASQVAALYRGMDLRRFY